MKEINSRIKKFKISQLLFRFMHLHLQQTEFSSLKTTNPQHLQFMYFVLETAQIRKWYQMYSEYIHNYFLIACKVQMNYISPKRTDFSSKNYIFYAQNWRGEGHRKSANHLLYFLILHRFGEQKKKRNSNGVSTTP